MKMMFRVRENERMRVRESSRNEFLFLLTVNTRRIMSSQPSTTAGPNIGNVWQLIQKIRLLVHLISSLTHYKYGYFVTIVLLWLEKIYTFL